MASFSLLIFSRNDIDNTIGLIDDLTGDANQIVVMDSSEDKHHKKLLDYKNSRKLSKMQIYKVPALGYPDPLRMYGLSKCKNEWVLLLDTDERLSDSLKRDIKLRTEEKFAAFAITRYEHVGNGNLGDLSTWQTRLFRKSKVVFRGLLHEQPLVTGTVEQMPNSYYIEHRNALRTGTGLEYTKIERFSRLDYALSREKMREYIAKASAEGIEQARNRVSTKFIIGIMQLYQNLGMKNDNQELSNLDYFLYFYMTNLGYVIKTELSIKELLNLPVRSYKYMKYIDELKHSPDGPDEFEISRSINQIGITKFLDLDKEAVILDINRKYGAKQQGISLLIGLLKTRYAKAKKAKRIHL